MVNAFSSIPQPSFPPPSLNKPAGGAGGPMPSPGMAGGMVGGAAGMGGNMAAAPIMPQQPMANPMTTQPEVVPAAGMNSLRETPQFGTNAGGNGAKPPSMGGKKINLFGQKVPLTYMLGGLFFILLTIGLGAGFFLSQQGQDVRQQASGGTTYPTYVLCCVGGKPAANIPNAAECSSEGGYVGACKTSSSCSGDSQCSGEYNKCITGTCRKAVQVIRL